MPVTPDQLAGVLVSLGPTGTALAVAAVPIAVGIAVYVTRMGSQARIDRLEGELSRLENARREELAKAEAKYTELDGRYQAVLRRGALIQIQLQSLMAEVEEVAEQLDASDFGVLVPAPTFIAGDKPDEMVFLCASGSQAAQLQWTRVPIARSLSGQAYVSGQPTISSPSGTTFATRTDKAINYTTKDTLNVCLGYKGERVGVAQFVNKRSGKFDTDDRDRAVPLCTTIARLVNDFTSDPRRLVELGHAPRKNQINVTVLFMDLSNYHVLFSHLDSSVITDLLNQYFQELCAIAFQHGATVDHFLGDGALFVFNIDQNKDGHQKTAVVAAAKMRAKFEHLRKGWSNLGYGGTEAVFARFGLSCGRVTRAELGHTQGRRMTVIGPAVNAAAYACDAGPRDRDVICVTEDLKDNLSDAPEFAIRPVASLRGETIFEAVPEPLVLHKS